MIKKALYLGLGIFSVTRERTEKMLAELMDKGEITGEEAKQVMDDLVARGEEEKQAIRNLVQEEIGAWKKDFKMVTRSEFEALQARIEALEKNLQQ